MHLLVLIILFSINLRAFNCSYSDKSEWIESLEFQIQQEKAKYKISPAVLNAIITQKYASLMQSDNERTRLVGYFYHEASFHLGRITRFNKWPFDHPLREQDRSFIKGKRLKLLLNVSPHMISSKLMHYSEKLFYELFWSFHALELCGKSYVISLINDENLKLFHSGPDPKIAFKYFLTYEQTYLQNTLYRDIFVRPIMKAGVVDQMRWISFPDIDGSLNFQSWCSKVNCNTSSFNLKNRILFDLTVLQNELNQIIELGFNERTQKSESLSINQEFLSLFLY